MHLSKRGLSLLLAVLLAAALLLSALIASLPLEASASVESNINRLTEWQQDYLRVIRSLALKDFYDTGILASINAGQAIYEGGWARYAISVIANNQYGIKAYSSWKGKVFDNGTYTLYDSYEELVRIKGSSYARHGSIWRAYDSWEASVSDHSALFHNESRYVEVLTAKDYREAAERIVKAGYTSDYGYIATLIRVIEDYGLDQLDNVTTDENGVFGMIMNQARAVIPIGDTLTLSAAAYPEPVSPRDLSADESSTQDESSGDDSDPSTESDEDQASSDAQESSATVSRTTEPIPYTVTWASNAPSIATVDENGTVTAHAQGIALITATYNGKEAACLVCVGTNAFVIDSDTQLYSQPDSDSNSLGKIYRGMPICIQSSRIYTSDDGSSYYQVRGTTSTGALRTGYINVKRVYSSLRGVTVLNAKTELNLETDVYYQVGIEIAPADAEDKTLTWVSSNPTVASVNSDGVIATHQNGTAIITVTAASGVFLNITVNVGQTTTYRGVTTANLYVRTEPNTDAPALGLIAEGTEILLLGEPVGGWYQVEATVIDGSTVRGYSYATYIELPGNTPVDPDPPTPPDPPVPPEPPVQERTGIVHVDDGSSLNIRDEAGTSGRKVLSVDNGTLLTIIGDDITLNHGTYKIWYHVQVNLDGMFYEGYAAAAFITLTSTTPDPPSPSTIYTVSETVISGVVHGTSCAEFRQNLGSAVQVYQADGTPRADQDAVATNDEVRYLIGSTVVRTRRIAVRGDLNGDAKVDARDYILLKRAALKIVTLTDAPLQAALLTGKASPSAGDYIRIKRAVLFGSKP